MVEESGEPSDGSFHFPTKFAIWVAVVVAALTTIFYAVNGLFTDTAIFFAAAVAAGGTITTAFYVACTLTLYINQEDYRRRRETGLDERGKKERALSYGARWNDPQLFYVRDVCREILDMRGKTEEEIKQYAEEKKTNVVHLLNFLEEISFSVEQNLVDIDLTKDQFKGIVHSLWQLLEPWITQHRAFRGRRDIWDRLEALDKAWR